MFLITGFVIMSGGCGGGGGSVSDDEGTPEDDYYAFVNSDWLAKTTIPDDRSNVSNFSLLDDEIRAKLLDDFKSMTVSGVDSDIPWLDNSLKYYNMFMDMGKRDSDGLDPASDDLRRIDALNSLGDISSSADQLILDNFSLPFAINVDKDPYNERYILSASAGSTFIPEPSYYETGDANGERVIPLLRDYLTKLFTAAGLEEASAQAEAENAIAFDRLLADLCRSAEEQNDVTTGINVVTYEDFAKKSENIDLEELIEKLTSGSPKSVGINEINIEDTKFWDAFDTLYSEKNFTLMKSWIKGKALDGYSLYLDSELLSERLNYDMKMNGSDKPQEIDEAAFDAVSSVLGDPISIYYGGKYFSAQARSDVEEMVRDILAEYRGKISENSWLGDATKEKAIAKLDTMTLRIGYPDSLPPKYDSYDDFIPSEQGGSLYGNTVAIGRASNRYIFSRIGEKPDNVWQMTSYTVNAYYEPEDNSINFPAGILSAPFYSFEKSRAENAGSIGMVIGHEVSHAFDPNGALYDEEGNYKNWWTDSDKAEFSRRSEVMVNLFDGISYAGIKINGKLTLGENTADATGLECALGLVDSSDNEQLKAFFESYATMWRNKARQEYEALRYTTDPHSPPKLRVNVQLSNCDKFYDVYDVVEGDAMYLAPEKRVTVW
jgi:putative endopeptidase